MNDIVKKEMEIRLNLVDLEKSASTKVKIDKKDIFKETLSIREALSRDLDNQKQKLYQVEELYYDWMDLIKPYTNLPRHHFAICENTNHLSELEDISREIITSRSLRRLKLSELYEMMKNRRLRKDNLID